VRSAEWASSGPGHRGLEGLEGDLDRHRTLMGARSPVYQRALQILRAVLDARTGDPTIVAKLERSWRERAFGAFYERPLLLLAALRQDAVAEGTRHPLHEAFATDTPDEKAVTREAISQALAPMRLSVWLTLATRRVQTNEVSRAVTWLWPALLAGCDDGRRPIAIFDIGASAGLNLVGDALPSIWVDSTRAALPVARRVTCVQRVGFEPSPLDVRVEDDVAWMRACVWPGETKRLARFEMAVAAMRAALVGPEPRPRIHTLAAHSAPARLDAALASAPPNVVFFAYQTFVRGYLETEKREAYLAGMRRWVASAPPGRACWLEMELIDGAPEGDPLPAELVAHVNIGAAGDTVKSLRLARCSYHPHEIAVDAAGGNEFVRRMRA
jgi:hypothetical protein